MAQLLHKFPLDKTGAELDNYVMGEVHDISHLKDLPIRVFTLNHGYFYKENLRILDANGFELTPEVDYHLVYHNIEISKLTGLEAYALIAIDNPRVTSEVHVSAQMVGGVFEQLGDAIIQAVQTLEGDNRAVSWDRIEGKPAAFKPGGHLHALWELYGFNPYILEVLRLIEHLLEQDATLIQHLKEWAENDFQALDSIRQVITDLLNEHIESTNNPHKTTKAHIELGSVANHPVALESDARDLIRFDRYLTPALLAVGIKHNFIDYLTVHKADVYNPHRVTAEQINVYTRDVANTLLNGKLGIRERAVNSTRLEGLTYNEVLAEGRKGLPASALTTGILNTARLGSGTADATRVLLGNGVWTPISSLFTQYESEGVSVYKMGNFGSASAGLNSVRSTYADINRYPVGTIVLFTHNQSFSNRNNNSSRTHRFQASAAAVRRSSGWSLT